MLHLENEVLSSRVTAWQTAQVLTFVQRSALYMYEIIRLASKIEAYVLVDKELYPQLMQHNWYRRESGLGGNKLTAYRFVPNGLHKKKTILMHRAVISLLGLNWSQVSHINGNGLDNRFVNLEPPKHVLSFWRSQSALEEHRKTRPRRNYQATNSTD